LLIYFGDIFRLTEIANIGAGKAAKHLSVLLNDTVKMTVPKVIYGSPDELPKMLETDPSEILVGIEQQLTGFFKAKVTFLFFAHDSASLAQDLIGQDVREETGVDMRALQYDAITEIGNIVIASCIKAMSEVLDGSIQLSLPIYAEGSFSDLVCFPEKNKKNDAHVLIMKTQLEAVRRNVSGAIILVISDTNLEFLMQKINDWIKKLSS
jgi:chemotaxis protein CheC